MEDKEQLAVVPVKKKGFQPGHPRFGGRVKAQLNKKTWVLRELAEQQGRNPGQLLLDVAFGGVLASDAAVDLNGKPVTPVAVSVEERLKCLRDVIRYVMPSLSAVALTGADGGPVQLQAMDVVELMRNPALAQAAQTLALGLSTAQREGITAISNDTDGIIDAEPCEPDE